MIRKVLAATAVAVMMGSASADYAFPSPVNPAGKDASQVDQYITIIWDDNAYSGLDGTTYEAKTGTISWADGNCVGGKAGLSTHGFPSWTPSKNELNIEEGDMGMAWAINLPAKQTFNMISGLYVPTENPSGSPDIDGDGTADGWANRESPLGYYKPNSADNNAGVNHTRIAVSWGREQEISDGGQKIQPACATIVTEMALAKGHEIGNHTIDHMESNSPLPGKKGSSPYGSEVQGESKVDGFDAWGGEGFDNSKNDTMPWGEVINEATEFGQEDGQSAQYMGWKVYAGKYISKEAWKGAIEIGQEWLTNSEGAGVSASKIKGFRAPRLEVSSGLFHALAELNYMYDCGLEEGYEDHRDGTNFLWPYTTDNGGVNVWTQYSVGERRSITSWPAGLWQLPVNTLVVPENIRESVWANYEKVQLGEGYDQSYIDENKPYWIDDGKVTGFDFNTFILWGMTTDNWKKTMENTVQLRLDGNKAPLHYGAHTDYYTPIYDFQTLLTDFNKDAFGLCVVNNWNTWDTRITAMEQWIDWAKGKGCQFVTGQELVAELNTLAGQAPSAGSEFAADGEFALYVNENISSKTTASKNSFSGGSADIDVTVAAPEGDEYPYAAYRANVSAEEITHVSLNYQTDSGALAIRLLFDGAPSREVLLNNINNESMVASGMIPVYAFDYNKYEDKANVTYDAIDFSKLTGIEVQPLAPDNKHDGSYSARTEPYDMSFKIQDFKIYGKEVKFEGIAVSHTVDNSVKTLGLNEITNNSIALNIAATGKYNVSIMKANGQIVTAFNNQELAAGVNNITFDNLATGVYMVNVDGINNNQTLSQKAIIK